MRYIIGIICIALIILRAIFPALKFDNISLILLILGLIVLLFPELKELISRIKKVKFPGGEVELAEKLKILETKTEKAETNIFGKSRTIELSSGVEAIVSPPLRKEDSKNYLFISDKEAKKLFHGAPKVALLQISIEIERKLRYISIDAKIPSARKPYPISKIINSLTQKGILNPELIPIFKDFWDIRNKVVHGLHFELSEGKLYELIELGRRILQLLPITKREILEKLKEKGINILVKPCKPKKYEKDEFYIEKVEEIIILKNIRLGQYINISLFEIRSIYEKMFPPVLYLMGKLKWNPKLDISGELEYIPPPMIKI